MTTNSPSPLPREHGAYPACAWPGGYPFIYLTEDGGVLCSACANRENGSEASEAISADPQWKLVGADTHWEGAPIHCDHCGAAIESAYGEPEPEAPDPGSSSDIEVANEGTIFTFQPITAAGREWLEAHTEGTWYGGALVVEHRYAWDLAQAAKADGLRVS